MIETRMEYVFSLNDFNCVAIDDLDKESKAYNLIEAKKVGLQVPDSIIFTAKCYEEYVNSNKIPKEAILAVKQLIEEVERMGRIPLFSVRCGDKNKHKKLPATIVNVGIGNIEEKNLNKAFIEENNKLYEMQIEKVRNVRKSDSELYSKLKSMNTQKESNLTQCICAIEYMYETLYYLSQNSGEINDATLILQAMVFGNISEKSCYGTAYTRNPYTGEEMEYGEYVSQKQGVEANEFPEDMWKDMSLLKFEMPAIYEKLKSDLLKIEKYCNDIRFVEFIVENEELYYCQLSKRNRKYFPEIFNKAK